MKQQADSSQQAICWSCRISSPDMHSRLAGAAWLFYIRAASDILFTAVIVNRTFRYYTHAAAVVSEFVYTI
jgi:hypothetical protein